MKAGPMNPSRDDVLPGAAGMQAVRAARVSSRSDIFPRVVSIQKNIGARHFAILKSVPAGPANKRKLVCELENWGMGASGQNEALIGAHGDSFLENIETSLLCLVWNGAAENHSAQSADFTPLLKRLDAGKLPYSGVAFPVRLGTVGNGFVAFFANNLDLTADILVDTHIRCCQIMADFLMLDDRRPAAAEGLSEREIACLQLAGDGRISEEIAEKLGLSVHTVNAYLGSATIKLDSVNRIQAIAKAIRLGYIH